MDGGVGRTLREARTRRKIDLTEVEASTKIRARYLRAIENEEWDQLPGDAYARGFIRTYADYLGLDGGRLVEEQRRLSGESRPEERLPRVDPLPRAAGSRRRMRRSPGLLTALVVGLLVAILVIVGLMSGGESGPTPSSKRHATRDRGHGAPAKTAPSVARGVSLRLTTSAEVWVCLLDGKGKPLIEGQVLSPGSVEGPYRSGSFTVSFGNGEVTMTVNGQQASIPETSSPIGFAIDRGGAMRELSEGERPTCT